MTDHLSLIAWVKANAKDGANVAEFEELANQFAIPESQPEAINWMQKIPALRSALDAEKNREYDKGAKAFEEKKLPEREKALRDTIYKELHPEESPLEKRVREQDERIKMFEEEKKRNERKIALMGKGKEVGIDSEIAADYAVFGDQADEVMKRHADHWKAQLDAVKNQSAQKTFGNKTPVQGSSGLATKRDQMMARYKELNNAGRGAEATLVYLEMQELEKEV